MATTIPQLEHTLNCGEWLELLDELNIGAFIADANRLICAINYTAQAIMELKAAEVIGKDQHEIRALARGRCGEQACDEQECESKVRRSYFNDSYQLHWKCWV